MGAFEEIEHLVATVDGGSFAAAARRLGVTPSAVSRRVAQLEADLGVPLLARTTRSLRLTVDGSAFYERCVRILEELAEARDAMARARGKPSGTLRVDVPVALGRKVLAPALPALMARYPDVRLEITLRDPFVDPVAEGLDVVVRMGALSDSTLIARRLGETRIVHVAAPSYLAARGRPRTPADLKKHACIGHLIGGRPNPFGFVVKGATVPTAIDGPAHTNDAEVIAALARGGRGIAALFDFLVTDDLTAGTLETVLTEHPATLWPIHALYPKNRHLLPKVAVFLDWLAATLASPRVERRRKQSPLSQDAREPERSKTKPGRRRTKRSSARRPTPR